MSRHSLRGCCWYSARNSSCRNESAGRCPPWSSTLRNERDGRWLCYLRTTWPKCSDLKMSERPLKWWRPARYRLSVKNRMNYLPTHYKLTVDIYTDWALERASPNLSELLPTYSKDAILTNNSFLMNLSSTIGGCNSVTLYPLYTSTDNQMGSKKKLMNCIRDDLAVSN
jgi:hypothetical protein